ncbi:Uncharacterized protein Rs2_35081 [Raphanus sativus]|nr:Uncharacterized protein Rs2_35081 [Raphanus sativus]
MFKPTLLHVRIVVSITCEAKKGTGNNDGGGARNNGIDGSRNNSGGGGIGTGNGCNCVDVCKYEPIVPRLNFGVSFVSCIWASGVTGFLAKVLASWLRFWGTRRFQNF